MNNYGFKLFVGDSLVGEGYSYGHSAMEAFENGVKTGSICFDDGVEVEVHAMSDQGIGIKFNAIKGF